MKKTLGTLLKIFVGGMGVGFAESLCTALVRLGINKQYEDALKHENELLIENNNKLHDAIELIKKS